MVGTGVGVPGTKVRHVLSNNPGSKVSTKVLLYQDIATVLLHKLNYSRFTTALDWAKNTLFNYMYMVQEKKDEIAAVAELSDYR